MALGAAALDTADFILRTSYFVLPTTSGSLGHPAAAQASRADANPFDAAVDQRPNLLQIRFESPCAHVVRMAMLPADDRTLAAHFTSLGHIFSFQLTAFSIQLRRSVSAPE